MKVLLLITCLSLAGTTNAFASWILVILDVNTETVWLLPTVNTTLHGSGGKMFGQCGRINGHVYARANTLSTSSASLAGVTWKYELWQHLPPGVGEVELFKGVDISGEVSLRDGPGSATVTGKAGAYHKFNSLDWRKLEADLVLSRTTSDIPVGSISGTSHGITATSIVNLTQGLGTASHPGLGTLLEFDFFCPVSTYQSRVLGQLELQAYATTGLFQWNQSQARAEGEAISAILEIFLTWPECP